ARHQVASQGNDARTIPTCVGSTDTNSFWPLSQSDHPHVRGEHSGRDIRLRSASGPSPRAWGALGMSVSFLGVGRTIPTCVGSTLTSTSVMLRCPDHPHVRGEHPPGSWWHP